MIQAYYCVECLTATVGARRTLKLFYVNTREHSHILYDLIVPTEGKKSG